MFAHFSWIILGLKFIYLIIRYIILNLLHYLNVNILRKKINFKFIKIVINH